jgi:hypothetical protein
MTVYNPTDEQELLRIRETIIAAVASDDALVDLLVLKGGNALDIVYQMSARSSLDMDFSMEGDFETADDVSETSARLFAALRDRFDALGYVLFDEAFVSRPRGGGGPGIAWGGYNALFKLISRKRFIELGGSIGVPAADKVLEAIRRESQVTGIGSQRNFVIEISKFEYTEGKQLVEVGGFDCYVYSPAMIAIEKLRAICQQSPEYPLRKNPTPRPRDFFDIHAIASHAGCDIAAPEHHKLVRAMFAAKSVALDLIAGIGAADRRAFHAQQWPAVLNAVRGGPSREFDFYFDFVAAEGRRLLEALRLEEA